MDVNATIVRLIDKYGKCGAPSEEQWLSILELPDGQPISLVNFFKLREMADYSDGRKVSGKEAFDAYATVSGPALERAGGNFTFMAPFHASFIGPPQEWDLVVVGSYPNKNALLALFDDRLYAEAYPHRTAACDDQVVSVCLG